MWIYAAANDDKTNKMEGSWQQPVLGWITDNNQDVWEMMMATKSPFIDDNDKNCNGNKTATRQGLES